MYIYCTAPGRTCNRVATPHTLSLTDGMLAAHTISLQPTLRGSTILPSPQTPLHKSHAAVPAHDPPHAPHAAPAANCTPTLKHHNHPPQRPTHTIDAHRASSNPYTCSMTPHTASHRPNSCAQPVHSYNERPPRLIIPILCPRVWAHNAPVVLARDLIHSLLTVHIAVGQHHGWVGIIHDLASDCADELAVHVLGAGQAGC